MIKGNTYQITLREILLGRLANYAQLVKMRLTSIVVISAGLGYLFAIGGGAINWGGFVLIMLGGFLITGAANAFNEVIEKDTDKLMARTADRPLPAARMSVTEAIMVAGIMAVAGISILAYSFNTLSALVGATSLLIYAFIYTPLKRTSNLAVFVGAIPGALPPAIGWIAYSGSLDLGAFLLFGIQFLWQFPHFWAIAWVAHEDYKKGGFHLLPSAGGKNKESAFQNVAYTVFLLPVSLLPFILGFSGWISAVVALVMGVMFLGQAFKLYFTLDNKAAKQLMFGSFIYLPVVLLALVIDKI